MRSQLSDLQEVLPVPSQMPPPFMRPMTKKKPANKKMPQAAVARAAGLPCAAQLFHVNATMHELFFLVLLHVKRCSVCLIGLMPAGGQQGANWRVADEQGMQVVVPRSHCHAAATTCCTTCSRPRRWCSGGVERRTFGGTEH